MPIKVTARKRRKKGRRKDGQVRLHRDDARRNKRMDGWRKERLKARRGKEKGIYIYIYKRKIREERVISRIPVGNERVEAIDRTDIDIFRARLIAISNNLQGRVNGDS